jgi:glycosyltransferase involved in cell wall biosynthesis
VREERKALQRADVVITNSERTKQDLIEQLNIPAERIHTIYYGTDPDRFRPLTQDERCAIREKLGWAADQPIVAFVGALGDRRKGFDSLFAAWKALCADPMWDATLVVIGTGAELPAWTAHAINAGLDSRICFLGFRTDVPRLLSVCDALVAPTRYEAYGLAVQEALCCGIPALVTRAAGVAERYPSELHDLLIPDPNNIEDLVARLQAWREHAREFQSRVTLFSVELRSHTWSRMASQLVSVCEHTK